MMKKLSNGFRSRSLMNDNNAVGILIIMLIMFVVMMVAGLLFLMWLLSNMWDFVVPICIIIVVAILAKRFLLEKKGATA